MKSRGIAKLRYLLLPIVLLSFMLLQFLLSLVLGEKASVATWFQGEASERSLFSEAARAGRAARLDFQAGESILGGASGVIGLVICEEGFAASSLASPDEGLDSGLEGILGLARKGASVLLGYRAISGTDSPEALASLSEAGGIYAAGIDAAGWEGAYVNDLGKHGAVPEAFREAWERQEGKAFEFRGGGLILLKKKTGEALVLSRGRELGKGALRVKGAGADGYFSGWFSVLEARPGTSIRASFELDLLEEGKAACARAGIPPSFPALLERSCGAGRLWIMAGDFSGRQVGSEFIGPLPAPTLERKRTLDSPENSIALFHRILVPMLRTIIDSVPRS